MSLIEVDDYRCTRCGICTDVCPSGIVTRKDEHTLPSVAKSFEKICIRCGHCEVFCPSQALVFNNRPEERIVLPAEGHTISPDTLSLYLKKRRSIRHFTRTHVSEETILNLIETASYAASGGNRQPVSWLVIHDFAKVRRIAELTIEWMKSLLDTDHPMSSYFSRVVAGWNLGRDTICLGAPHLIFTHIPDGNPAAFVDAAIAMTYIDITAPSMGIGTCWAGFIMMAASSSESLREELALPEGHKVACAMMLGFPKYKAYGIPRKNPPDVTWRL